MTLIDICFGLLDPLDLLLAFGTQFKVFLFELCYGTWLIAILLTTGSVDLSLQLEVFPLLVLVDLFLLP